jgi:hypothetical protein
LSATTTFWVLDATVGHLAAATLSTSVRLGIAGIALAALLSVDIAGRRRGRTCSPGPTRQTPRRLGWSRVGVFLWGLDTGVPMTTVRASGLPLAALLATALGLGAPWLGALYALGFLGALATACVLPSPATADGVDDRDAIDVAVTATASLARAVGQASLGLAAATLTVLSLVTSSS